MGLRGRGRRFFIFFVKEKDGRYFSSSSLHRNLSSPPRLPLIGTFRPFSLPLLLSLTHSQVLDFSSYVLRTAEIVREAPPESMRPFVFRSLPLPPLLLLSLLTSFFFFSVLRSLSPCASVLFLCLLPYPLASLLLLWISILHPFLSPFVTHPLFLSPHFEELHRSRRLSTVYLLSWKSLARPSRLPLLSLSNHRRSRRTLPLSFSLSLPPSSPSPIPLSRSLSPPPLPSRLIFPFFRCLPTLTLFLLTH